VEGGVAALSANALGLRISILDASSFREIRPPLFRETLEAGMKAPLNVANADTVRSLSLGADLSGTVANSQCAEFKSRTGVKMVLR
jgi:hypothetical protein